MATIYRLKTFADLLSAVRDELQLPSTDTLAVNRLKRDLNIVYEEIASLSRWSWLRRHITLTAQPYIGTSSATVTVTQASAEITLSAAPAYSIKGYWFSASSDSELYRIAQHTAGATTATLETVYTGSSSSTNGYKIWTDVIPLPADCRETIEVSHQYSSRPLESVGLQEFRRITASSPKSEGKPQYYALGDYKDPLPYSTVSGLPAISTMTSSGLTRTIVFATTVASYFQLGDNIEISANSDSNYNGKFVISSVSTTTITFTGALPYAAAGTVGSTVIKKLNVEGSAERYRELLVYPAINNTRVTMHVDYVRELVPFENDSDEPLIPQEFRMSLVYGALHRAWSRERNPEEATRNYQLFQKTVDRMMGKLEDSVDMPLLQPSGLYMRSKRNIRKASNSLGDISAFGSASGGGGATVITGTANRLAIYNNNGELTHESSVNDITVNAGGTVDITAGVIVNADINASAAIVRSKTATGTAYRILANNSSGVMSENAALTAAQVVITDANGQLTTTATLSPTPTSVTLTDNTGSATTAASWTAATYDSITLTYSMKRGSSIKSTGTLQIATDGTNASIAQSETAIGAMGVTFTVDVSAGSLRLRYTTTSTGTDVTMKYVETKWLA